MKDTLISLVGVRFERWLVLERAPNKGRAVMWKCECDCGSIKTVAGTSLKTGVSGSCGCLYREGVPRTHGKTHYPLYRVWQRMKGCTTSTTHQDYKFYGAKGVSVCEEWTKYFQSFYDWATSHGYAPGLTIERIDVYGNYEPKNCTWIPLSEQWKNKRLREINT